MFPLLAHASTVSNKSLIALKLNLKLIKQSNNTRLINFSTMTKKIKELQHKLWLQPFNQILIKHINRLILQREKLFLFNQKSWGHNARKTWRTQGDCNSRFFHSRLKKTMPNLTIFRLKNNIGQWIDSHDDLTSLLSDSFKKQFKSSHSANRQLDLHFIDPFASQQDSANLLVLVSNEEIKNAIFGINPLKFPRSDGFSAKFYQGYWPIIQSKVTTVIQSLPKERLRNLRIISSD